MAQLFEAQDRKIDALKIYTKYTGAAKGQFRDRMEERYQVLKRETIKEEMLQLLENESAIGALKVSHLRSRKASRNLNPLARVWQKCSLRI